MPFTNRMNPAGVPMFYGALDRNTAIVEVRSNQPTAASIGEFELLHEIRVVDLTALPPARGIFANGARYEKAAIGFLHQFMEDATLPIERDGREHIEYVPTQIVTEYFRHIPLRVRARSTVTSSRDSLPKFKIRAGFQCRAVCRSL
jgi:hypothetical protein